MSLASPVFLVGPTGVGKTAVALPLARALRAEILSIDSRQLYRDMEIGTAKPTAAERAAVTHHLLDLCDPRERISAGAFRAHYDAALTTLRRRGVAALAVGGSGLYVDACLGRLDALPPGSEEASARQDPLLAREGPAGLHRRLSEVDPQSAARLAPRDVQRVARALEVYAQTGVPLSRLQQQGGGPLDLRGRAAMVLLIRDRATLYARIAARAAAMLDAGLLDEVRRLLTAGVPADAPAMEAIGYGEFARVIAGEASLEAAFAAFVRRTRRYAKRQLTWFRNRYAGQLILEIGAGEEPGETARRALALLGGASPAPDSPEGGAPGVPATPVDPGVA